jgi:hypothetical protein
VQLKKPAIALVIRRVEEGVGMKKKARRTTRRKASR